MIDSPAAIDVFHPIEHGALPPFGLSSNVQSEISTSVVPSFVNWMYCSLFVQTSPSPSRSNPPKSSLDEDVRISVIFTPR